MENKNKPITLIGMPGCGKSTISISLGKKLNKTVYDLDKCIEEYLDMSIPEIFETKGEDYFRNAETFCLEKLLQKQNVIIATGGGAILRNSALLKSKSTCIYINRKISSILKTIGTKRPLSKSKEDLEKLYNERAELYKSTAHYTVINNYSSKKTAEKICKLLNYAS
jgi:Shikimate kinase